MQEGVFRMQGDATPCQASNLKIQACQVVMPTSKVSFVFEVTFNPIKVVPEQNKAYIVGCVMYGKYPVGCVMYGKYPVGCVPRVISIKTNNWN